MVTKFEQMKGHELGVKKLQEEVNPTTKHLNVDKGMNPFEVGEM
jgi:hypothetical protein